jgi:hypothetical protein
MKSGSELFLNDVLTNVPDGETGGLGWEAIAEGGV